MCDNGPDAVLGDRVTATVIGDGLPGGGAAGNRSGVESVDGTHQ